jgi:nucleoside-diphosphate-sugar epimerase
VSIVVPALNEARNLARVLPTLPPDAEVVLVDGASTDDTVELALRLRPGIRVVSQSRAGKGNALVCGFAAATGDIIVTFDADGSAQACEIPRFVEALLMGADLAKGSRFLAGGDSDDLTAFRKVGNHFLNGTTNVLFRTRFTDLCYGFNACWRDVVDLLELPPVDTGSTAPVWGDGFEIETLLQCRAVKRGLRVTEVASVELNRLDGASNLHAVRDGFRVLRTILQERWGARDPLLVSEPAPRPEELQVVEQVVGDDVVIDLTDAAMRARQRPAREVIEDLVELSRTAATPDADTLDRLSSLTTELAGRTPCAVSEYERFAQIPLRHLGATDPELAATVEGRTILVTGATGCIGAAVVQRCLLHGAARVVGVSRGRHPYSPEPGAEYRVVDVRDRAAVDAVISDISPDLIFHLAAVRDPGRAEREVREAVTTNLAGTATIMASADELGVPKLVLSSSGKTVRYYTEGVYALTKKLCEWMFAEFAPSSATSLSASRFTHIVDNSIIHQRLLAGLDAGQLRLHAPYMAMYAQSALEAAELMLYAARDVPAGSCTIYSMQDLGMFFDVLEMTLGLREQAGSDAALVFTGYAPGYEIDAYPGLYRPEVAVETGALVNALEADSTESLCREKVNSTVLKIRPTVGRGAIEALAGIAAPGQSDEQIIASLRSACRMVFDCVLDDCTDEQLEWLSVFAECPTTDPEHAVINDAVRSAMTRRAVVPAVS